MTKEDEKQEKIEEVTVEQTAKALGIASQLFGSRADFFAMRRIFTLLDNIEPEKEEELASDLKRVIERVKIAFKTEEPTPEQVFWFFGEIMDIDWDEETRIADLVLANMPPPWKLR